MQVKGCLHWWQAQGSNLGRLSRRSYRPLPRRRRPARWTGSDLRIYGWQVQGSNLGRLSRRFYIPEGAGRCQPANVPVFVAFPGRVLGMPGGGPGSRWSARLDERPGGRSFSRLTLGEAGNSYVVVGVRPRAQVVSFGRRAAAFIPSGVPAAGGRGGMGRVRVRAAGSIRPGGRPPVAGASKTSDHALPAAGPAHAASRVAVARSRTWPSRIA